MFDHYSRAIVPANFRGPPSYVSLGALAGPMENSEHDDYQSDQEYKF